MNTLTPKNFQYAHSGSQKASSSPLTHGVAVNPMPTASFGNNLVRAAHFVPNTSQTFLNRVVDGPLSTFFRATLEDFVMGVMAIDFIALFFPRSGKALTRSSKNYDPQQDPEAMRRTGISEKLYVAGQRLKRLNWTNFVEEFSRELCGGPGLFIPTAILYGVFRKGYGKSAVQLHGDTMKNFSERFVEQAGKEATEAFDPNNFDEKKFKQFKNKFIHELIDFEDMAGPGYDSKALAQDKKFLENWVKEYTTTLDNKPEYGGRWTPWKDSKIAENYKEWTQQRDNLEAQLNSRIKQIRSKNPDRHLNRLNRIVLKTNWMSGDKVIQADNFADRVTQWNDFTNTVRDQWKKAGGNFKDAFNHVFKKVRRLKGMYWVATVAGTLSALLAGVYLFQHNNEYPANRTVRLQDLNLNKFKKGKKKKSNTASNGQLNQPARKQPTLLQTVENQVTHLEAAQKNAHYQAENILSHSALTPAGLSVQQSNQLAASLTPSALPNISLDRFSNGQQNVVSFAPLTPRLMYPTKKSQTPTPSGYSGYNGYNTYNSYSPSAFSYNNAWRAN